MKNRPTPQVFENPATEFNNSDFRESALALFRAQYLANTLYRTFVDTLGIRPDSVLDLTDIPFLPIRFFKTHRVVTGEGPTQRVFRSSGTAGMGDSLHHVTDTSLYDRSHLEGFRRVFGDLKDWCILALLPSYLERGDSSLVYMADAWMSGSRHPDNGFFLQQFDTLNATLRRLELTAQKTLLLGVTFALLDFSERHPGPLKHTIVVETGGMKGRRTEMIRAEVHALLKDRWGLDAIHAEYGMTELLSQAYAPCDGIFRCPPWMQVRLRAEDDPLERYGPPSTGIRTGLVDIIDLANSNSCAFIATDDVGKLYPDGSFEIIGRLDHSDLRGCSLLAV